MNGILDNSLVGIALLASLGYAMLALGPRSLRRSLLAALSRVTARAPASFRLRRSAQWLATAAAGKSQGACGGCDDCGSEKTPAEKAPAPEVLVSVRDIGRRS